MTLTITEDLESLIEQATEGLDVDKEAFLEKTREKGGAVDKNCLIRLALENIDEANPDWTFVGERLYLQTLYEQAAVNRRYEVSRQYGDFHQLISRLADKGIYSDNLLKSYTRQEIDYFGSIIEPERDLLFNYLGLYTLATRYLATDHDKNIYELPQERWMVIAMHLMQDEHPEYRSQYVAEAYWALSNLYMTVATPTLTNAGKTHGQLSSCFIDTVDDSLQSIYDSNTDIAKLSKNGGGIGVCMGQIRSRG